MFINPCRHIFQPPRFQCGRECYRLGKFAFIDPMIYAGFWERSECNNIANSQQLRIRRIRHLTISIWPSNKYQEASSSLHGYLSQSFKATYCRFSAFLAAVKGEMYGFSVDSSSRGISVHWNCMDSLRLIYKSQSAEGSRQLNSFLDSQELPGEISPSTLCLWVCWA